MNIFEDLVVELKEEHLLEETVIDHTVSRASDDPVMAPYGDELVARLPLSPSSGISNQTTLHQSRGERFQPKLSPQTLRRYFSERVQALQFVDYVQAAVEGRVVGIAHTSVDDMEIKKVLHRFEQACSQPESDNCFEAESSLVNKLNDWEATLSGRDDELSPDSVRRYAEAANPPLSPQTLFAMLRFYHGRSYSERTQAKFDSVVTRLFSKSADGEKRDLLCSRADIRSHLVQRYKAWSGGQYQVASSAQEDTAPLILKFDEFITEAEAAIDPAKVLANDLLGRICEFKKSVGECLMIPEVTAAAVDCNIRISNKIIDLISTTIAQNGGQLPPKYAEFGKSFTSDALGRTLEFGSPATAGGQPASDRRPKTHYRKVHPAERSKSTLQQKKRESRFRSNLLGVNRWLLLATVLAVVISVGIYVWSEYFVGDSVSTEGVKVIDLEKPELKKYIKVSKVSGDILYAVVSADYEKLDAESRREYLQNVQHEGTLKGYRRVSFINEQGAAVGFASEERIDTGNS